MSSSALTTSNSRWFAIAAFAAAAVLALAISHDLLHMPLQVNDCLSLILDASLSPSVRDTFYQHLSEAGHFRPLFYAEIKMLFDVANGHYALTYRLFHSALVCALILLFVRALHVRDRFSLAALPLGLTVFVGIHTFLGTVKELYPVTHFLQAAVLALVAVNLTQARGRLAVDVALLVTFALAALTLETGLLVWVIIVAAWISGMPGSSRRTVLAATALLAAYFGVRFIWFGSGLPPADERSTGFMFGVLEPAEITARFGDNLLPLRAYNVAVSMLSVLFSEPRSGVWVATRALVRNNLAWRDIINLTASLFATGLVFFYVRDRIRTGVRRPVTLTDRHVVIFAAVLAANAVMSYSYVKDEIVGVAGAAAYFLRGLHERALTRRVAIGVTLVFLLGSAAWATRAAGVHYVLRSQAFIQRNDWTRMERDWRQNGNWEQYASSQPLIRQLHDEAIATPVVNPQFVPRWMERVFDIYY